MCDTKVRFFFRDKTWQEQEIKATFQGLVKLPEASHEAGFLLNRYTSVCGRKQETETRVPQKSTWNAVLTMTLSRADGHKNTIPDLLQNK